MEWRQLEDGSWEAGRWTVRRERAGLWRVLEWVDAGKFCCGARRLVRMVVTQDFSTLSLAKAFAGRLAGSSIHARSIHGDQEAFAAVGATELADERIGGGQGRAAASGPEAA